MRSVSSKWFECKVQYEKVDDSGLTKKATESYIVDALSFTEAESAVISGVGQFISGEFEIKGIKPATFREVFFTDNTTDDKWFKVILKSVIIDEKTSKEKTVSFTYIVQAASFENAVRSIPDIISGSMMDFTTATVSETAFQDVFQHKS